MTDYVVTSEKLQDLNVLINEGGQIPSKVSQNLEGAEKMLAAGEYRQVSVYLNRAIAANIESGAAWSNVQNWHDSVKGEDGGNGGGEPPVTGQPVDPIPNDSVTRVFAPFPMNTKVQSHAGGAGRFAASIPSGSGQFKVWVNGALTVDGAMDFSPVQAGDLIEWMCTTQNSDSCNYSINP